jgi:hypothetical protein
MACPHVAGVAALGLSYAKQLKRHFTAEEFRSLMYTSARDIDNYFVGEKLYYLHHESAGATPTKMNLEEYRGKMGRLTDAGALLKAIEGSGRDMILPNICLSVGTTTKLNLDDYFTTEATGVDVGNSAIATAKLEDKIVTIEAIAEGQTTLTLKFSNGTEQRSTITVRRSTNDKGWL